MNETNKYSKVIDLLFFTNDVLTKDKLQKIREDFPGQPLNMDYRKEFIKGRGGSLKDKTWNRLKHLHICCQSKVPWRHKAGCHTLTDELKDI